MGVLTLFCKKNMFSTFFHSSAKESFNINADFCVHTLINLILKEGSISVNVLKEVNWPQSHKEKKEESLS